MILFLQKTKDRLKGFPSRPVFLFLNKTSNRVRFLITHPIRSIYEEPTSSGQFQCNLLAQL